MPTDTSFYNMRQPQPPDMMQKYAQMMQIRNSQVAQDINRERLQQEQMQTHQAQQAQQESDALQDLYVSNNGDLEKTAADAYKHGVRPEVVSKLSEQISKQKQARALMTKEQAAADEVRTNRLLGYMDPVETAASPEDRGALWTQQVNKAVQDGFAKPGELPDQYPGDKSFQVIKAGMLGHKSWLEESLKKAKEARDIETHDLDVAKKGADAAEAGLKLAATAVDPAMSNVGTPQEPVAANPAIAGNPLTGKLNAVPVTAPKVIQEAVDKQSAWDEMRAALPKGAQRFVPKKWSEDAEKAVRSMGVSPAERALVDQRSAQGEKNRVEAGDAARKSAASILGAADNMAQYTREYDRLPEEARKHFPPPGTWTKETPKSILRMGMTPDQQADNQRQDDKQTPGKGGMSESEYRSWYDKHGTLQREEQDQWKLAGEYGDLANAELKSEVMDPGTKKTVTVNDAVIKDFKIKADTARKKAAQIQQQAREIRGRLGGPTGGAQSSQAAPQTQSQAAPEEKWDLGGKSWTKGQTVRDNKSGKMVTVIGVKNGKLQVESQ